MELTQFNENNLKKLNLEIGKALQVVGREFGVDIRVGSCTFRPQNATFKVEVATMVDGEVQSKEIEDFRLYAREYGLNPDDLGRELIGGRGEILNIIGLLPRRRKIPNSLSRYGIWKKDFSYF